MKRPVVTVDDDDQGHGSVSLIPRQPMEAVVLRPRVQEESSFDLDWERKRWQWQDDQYPFWRDFTTEQQKLLSDAYYAREETLEIRIKKVNYTIDFTNLFQYRESTQRKRNIRWGTGEPPASAQMNYASKAGAGRKSIEPAWKQHNWEGASSSSSGHWGSSSIVEAEPKQDNWWNYAAEACCEPCWIPVELQEGMPRQPCGKPCTLRKCHGSGVHNCGEHAPAAGWEKMEDVQTPSDDEDTTDEESHHGDDGVEEQYEFLSPETLAKQKRAQYHAGEADYEAPESSHDSDDDWGKEWSGNKGEVAAREEARSQAIEDDKAIAVKEELESEEARDYEEDPVTEPEEQEPEKKKRNRGKRKPHTKRRGAPRIGRRWRHATLPVGASAVNLCKTSEQATNVLALVMLVLLAAFLMYAFYKRARPAQHKPQKSKVDKQLVGKSPQVIYFSSKATAASRCFHMSETCSALRRVSTVCSATACKLCVDQGTCVSVSSLD